MEILFKDYTTKEKRMGTFNRSLDRSEIISGLMVGLVTIAGVALWVARHGLA